MRGFTSQKNGPQNFYSLLELRLKTDDLSLSRLNSQVPSRGRPESMYWVANQMGCQTTMYVCSPHFLSNRFGVIVFGTPPDTIRNDLYSKVLWDQPGRSVACLCFPIFIRPGLGETQTELHRQSAHSGLT